MIEAHQTSSQALEAFERDLDLPLRWELAPREMEALRRQVEGERNRAGQERMMRLMQPGRANG